MIIAITRLGRTRSTAALLSCLCLIVGCKSSGQSGDETSSVVLASTELAGNPLVEQELEVLRPHVDPGGRTKTLEFELRNRSSEEQSFAYAIAWSDRSDKGIGVAQRKWILLTLAAGASTTVKVPFPASGAESWRLLAVRPEEVR
jgi:uncharacterized protein YcfL